MSSSSKYPSKLSMVDKDKELPDAPIVLTPLRKHARSPFFNRSRWTSTELSFTEQPAARPSEGRVRWIFTVPALIIMFLTFAMATILLLYLTAIRHVPNPTGGFDRSAIFVSGPSSNVLLGLTITTVSTHLVSISAPFLLSVSGYCVAGKWLQEQEFPRQTRVPLPTPLQYGFMVKMLTTSNISSVWQAGRYLRESKRRIRFPRAFYLAFVLTSVVLGLSYSLILADIWLHGSTFMVEGITTATAQDASLGVAFNNSICAGSLACLTDKGSWASQREVIQTGLLIAANSSDTLSVITLSNASDLAIVVPKSVDPSLTSQVPSFGIRAQCINETTDCTSSAALPSGCSQLSETKTNGTGTAANPQKVQLQIHWTSNGTVLPSAVNSMAIQANNSDILSGTMCNMTFYNLTLQYRSGKYSLAGEPVLADPAFAAVMQSGLLSQLGNFQLVSSLQATRLAAQNQSSSLAAMNQELSRLSLALFAGTLQTAASTTQQSALFGRYPLAPVIVYLFFLYSYAFTAGGIYIWAARLRSPLFRAPGRKTTSAMQLAQLHLTDPLALVATMYPSYADCPAPEDPREMFIEDGTTSRLAIGTDDGVNAHSRFGVYRRMGPWSAEIVEIG